MHITVGVFFQSNFKRVVKTIAQIVDVIVGKILWILLLVISSWLCGRCWYISSREQAFCTCLSFQRHSSLVLQEKASWLTYLLDQKVVGQALSLVRSFRFAPLLLLSGSTQWLANRECFCSHAEIYCCGLLSTRKSDCTGLPPSMLNNPETPQSRGQYRIRMKGNMSLICWYNKGHFRFLTNAYSPVQQGKQYSYCLSQKCACFMWQGKMSHWAW